MTIFLVYCPPNGKFTDILKYILWDFDKKSGYILVLLSIYRSTSTKYLFAKIQIHKLQFKIHSINIELLSLGFLCLRS